MKRPLQDLHSSGGFRRNDLPPLMRCKFQPLSRNPTFTPSRYVQPWTALIKKGQVSAGGRGQCLCLTLDEEVHRGGPRPTAGLDGAHVLALIRHVHVLNLDGELVLIQGHQFHSGIHRPFIFPGEQDAGAVEPRRVRDHFPLCAPATGHTQTNANFNVSVTNVTYAAQHYLLFPAHVCVIVQHGWTIILLFVKSNQPTDQWHQQVSRSSRQTAVDWQLTSFTLALWVSRPCVKTPVTLEQIYHNPEINTSPVASRRLWQVQVLI